MKLKPLRNKVVVAHVKTPDKTKSGIYIPDSLKKIMPFGEVVSIGEDVKIVSVGSKVMYDSRNPIDIELDGKNMFIIDDSDIIALIED